MEIYEYHDYDSLYPEKDLEREDTRERCKSCGDVLKDYETDYCTHCVNFGLDSEDNEDQTLTIQPS